MPGFKFLSVSELEKNFDALALAELKKYNAELDFSKLEKATPVRAAQLIYLDNLFAYIKKSNEPEEKKKMILAGAMLATKDQIFNSYYIRSADNSYVHANIDQALGISKDNVLDKISRQNAIFAYKIFIANPDIQEKLFVGVDQKYFSKPKLKPSVNLSTIAIKNTANILNAYKKDPSSPHHIETPEKPLDLRKVVTEKALESEKNKLKVHYVDYEAFTVVPASKNKNSKKQHHVFFKLDPPVQKFTYVEDVKELQQEQASRRRRRRHR